MIDNYIKYQSMSMEDLIDELEMLDKKLWKLQPNTPIYDQVLEWRHMCDSTLKEKYQIANMQASQKDPKSQVIEIGTIDKEEYTPDYNEEEVLNNIVEAYTKTLRSQHENRKTKTRKTR